MKARMINLVADGIVWIAAAAGAIGISLIASEVLITAQKLHW